MSVQGERFRSVHAAAGNNFIRLPALIKSPKNHTCVDARVMVPGKSSPGGVLWGRIAKVSEDEVAARLRKGGIRNLTTHPDCAACRSAYETKYPEERGKPGVQSRADHWGEVKTKKFADKHVFGFTQLTRADMNEHAGKTSTVFINRSHDKGIDPRASAHGYRLDTSITPKAAKAFRFTADVAGKKSGQKTNTILVPRR
ncbi:MAG: hypothetical protein AAB573_00940 [Patescibacteria group bacterium]